MLARFIGFLSRLVFGIIFYATPVIGFWLASSLEAYLGGPSWMAWTVGALLFPIIPLLWELHAWVFRKPDSKAWLTPIDRVSLKTFVVGLAFLCGLLFIYPQVAFLALSTRGDWMLDGVKDPRVNNARNILFAAAGGLEWLYIATKNNPYKAHIESEALQRTDEATQQREQEEVQPREQELAKQNQPDTGNSTQTNEEQIRAETSPQADQQSGEEVDENNKQTEAPQLKLIKKWPWNQTTLHPVVATMPASAETSINSVAKYISKREKDPILRIKALHDYVADRIAYDTVALYSDSYPDQTARTVFKTRKAVCAGYANLLSTLAKAIDEEIVVVPGDARDSENGDKLAGGGHAWNAARISGKWYLIDVCWDAGTVSRKEGFTKSYKTAYLLTPPEVMIQSHYPEEKTWQLLEQPLSLGDFLRQPMLDPMFQAANLTLIRPTRGLNETDSNAEIIVKNPDQQWLMVSLEQNEKNIGDGSEATKSKIAKLERNLPGKGRFRMNIYANKKQKYSEYDFVGAVDFVSR